MIYFFYKKTKLGVVPATMLMIIFSYETRRCIPHYIDDNDRKTSPPPPVPLFSFQRCALVIPPPAAAVQGWRQVCRQPPRQPRRKTSSEGTRNRAHCWQEGRTRR